MKIIYTKEGIEEMIAEMHVAKFGTPPAGQQWQIIHNDGDLFIEAVPVKNSDQMQEDK